MSDHERTGWRDAELSARHRAYGFACPAADLDLLLVEYHVGAPVAIIEYKHHLAKPVDLAHPTYRALKALADGFSPRPLPFLVVRYWPDVWAYEPQPVNAEALKRFRPGWILTERQYVEALYELRDQVLCDEVLVRLNTEVPS